MKKAKIMLAAIVVIAVVGGAVAFKAKRSTGELCLYTTTTTTTVNDIPVGTCQAPVVVTDVTLCFDGAIKFATLRNKNAMNQCPAAGLDCIFLSTICEE